MRQVRRGTGTKGRFAAALAAVVGCSLAGPATAPAQTDWTINGGIYRDLDGDGVRDAGESGVPDVVVQRNSDSVLTWTDATGAYSFTNGNNTSNQEIEVFTGWLRTQCPNFLTCPAGPGLDQDFPSANQFITITLPPRTDGTTTTLDGGFLPDFGDPGDPITNPPHASDLAMRLSGDFASCQVPASRQCGPGDTVVASLQIFNQGTAAATGVEVTLNWRSGLVPTGAPTAVRRSQAVTGFTVLEPYSTATRRMVVRLDGTLPPGGYARLRFDTTPQLPPLTPPSGYAWGADNWGEISTANPNTDEDSVHDQDPFNDASQGHNVNHPEAIDDDDHDDIGFNSLVPAAQGPTGAPGLLLEALKRPKGLRAGRRGTVGITVRASGQLPTTATLACLGLGGKLRLLSATGAAERAKRRACWRIDRLEPGATQALSARVKARRQTGKTSLRWEAEATQVAPIAVPSSMRIRG